MNINASRNVAIDAFGLKQPLNQATKEKESLASSIASGMRRSSNAEDAHSISDGSSEAGACGPYNAGDVGNLLGNWGQSNSPSDVDGSGTVDVTDLITMLLNWGQPQQAPGTPDVPPAETDPAKEASVDTAALTKASAVDALSSGDEAAPPVAQDPPAEGPYGAGDMNDLLVDWGQTGSQYDLDGNGTVDVNDLIAMILNWGSPQQPPPAQPVTPETEPESPARVAADTDKPMQRERPVRGEKPVNEDRPVRHEKPGWRIDHKDPNKRATDTDAIAADSTRAQKVDDTNTTATRPSLTGGELRKLTASLLDRLFEAGFKDHPPADIREIVGKLNLSSGDSAAVMKRLENAYPQGLGVNMRG